ncbi:serine/threonine-protein kinase [Streptomyces sp. BE133]|uniref:serine/threonine-protein kinase n=1 Tax=Streptomyces sp. BE133 TaxID=3002523 RepID=UPI002E794C94|nr:serine/threonine-protein kinase [Streptomyces sp. BE133]MEE1809979.1 serine/threonine-protein kinase [Streptomyces sp. BE133]
MRAGEAPISTGIGDILTPLGPDDPREAAGYRLLARIGEGGMGTVYLSHTRGGQAVALKLIRREFGDDPEFRLRFEQEVQAARRVQGYHLVPVVDHDTSGQQPWLASVFVPGMALQSALEAYGPLPLPTVFRLIGCTAQALAAIHAAGVVHRDLKPGNILLGATGPYVIDFGIARAADATQLTRSGGLVGTPQFMSPEHALGEQVGPPTDVFSLGLIAALAATGRHPYGTGGAMTVAAQIANTEHRPPRLDGYPQKLRPLLERCLAADPGARFMPTELAALCEQSAGRPLRESDGWLPEPLAAEIARREQASHRPPQPTNPATVPTYPPGTGPSGAGTTVPADPVPPGAQAGYAATLPTSDRPTMPRHIPTPPPPAPGPAPATAPTSKSHRPVRIAAAAGAALLLVAGTWVIATSGNHKGGDASHADNSRSNRPSSPQPDPKSSNSASPGSSAQQSSYKAIFQDRPFALRAPAEPNVIGVDLDEPRVAGPDEFTDGDDELQLSEVSGGSWEFRTPMGKSTGPAPEQCLQGSQSDVLPSEIREKELQRGQTLPVGTRLCTVTSDGNLAMLKITKVEKRATNDLPDYFTELTLWQQ